MHFILKLSLVLSAYCCYAAREQGHVDVVMNIDDYYAEANSMDSYTMVEYTTEWCSHCKALKPIFRDLMISYDDDEIGKPPIKFLDLNCEIFSSHKVCSELIGFPHINFIVPRDGPLVVSEPDYASMPFYQRWWTRLRRRLDDPKWQVEKERVYPYNGNRDVASMRSFIEQVRSKNELHRLGLRIVKDIDYNCENENDGQNVELCQLGQKYLENLDSNDLLVEESRLENLIANNKEDQLKPIRFKLEIVQLLKSEDQADLAATKKVEEPGHDEL